ncbi:DUF4438 domain-containing protein [Maliponia aquimaris]|uniref:DUF4438 domain-containing protein n=1 Tax=Maliponia aquimaris TaxID=1673631 RepID=A0A238L648_9RHOB|nr:DUF4438 domain-containing protein [Maliponia aquimaris]SMX50310.1 hypothetical protein MAA8898_04714 [Maliponia aquimaris]
MTGRAVAIDAPRMNLRELARISVSGRIAPPLTKGSAYRIGQDGGLRVLPGSGGITYSHRIGDRCVGLAADHLEPGVSIRNTEKSSGSVRDAANRALNALACVGNVAMVTAGPAAGAKGIVTGKHGGVANVLIDFPLAQMRRMRLGDPVQVAAIGQGLRLLDFPDVAVMNAAPDLIVRLGVRVDGGRLSIPVTHLVPAALMGSGLGKSSAARGDYDIQLFDRRVVAHYGLDRLRFGDFVAITDADGRYGRSFSGGHLTVGVVVHSDSTVAGHGPGVTTILSGPASRLKPRLDRTANLARLYGVRRLAAAKPQRTFVEKTSHLAPRITADVEKLPRIARR